MVQKRHIVSYTYFLLKGDKSFSFIVNKRMTLLSAKYVLQEIGVCPVCACSLDDGSELHRCNICLTPHHKDCYEYAGGCAIFGCRKGLARERVDNQIAEIHYPLTQSISSVDVALMWVWGKVLYGQWISALLAHYGVVSIGLGFSLVFSSALLSVVSPLYAAFITSLVSFHTFFYLSLFIGGISLVGICGYLASLLPDFIMQIHFGILNATRAACRMEIAKVMANRIDLPPYFLTLAKGLHWFAKSSACLSLILSFVSFLLVVLGYTSVPLEISSFITLSIAPIVGIIILAMLPTIRADMNSRLSYISTVQNRLIASAKDYHR
jgi:hypothetical protein